MAWNWYKHVPFIFIAQSGYGCIIAYLLIDGLIEKYDIFVRVFPSAYTYSQWRAHVMHSLNVFKNSTSYVPWLNSPPYVNIT